MGWLTATPEHKVDDKAEPWPFTRGGFYEAKGIDPPSVDLDAGQYLLSAMIEMGAVERDGMGNMLPLRWETLWAYAQATGDLAEPWEFRAIRTMSEAFINGAHSGIHPASIPPVEREEYADLLHDED